MGNIEDAGITGWQRGASVSSVSGRTIEWSMRRRIASPDLNGEWAVRTERVGDTFDWWGSWKDVRTEKHGYPTQEAAEIAADGWLRETLEEDAFWKALRDERDERNLCKLCQSDDHGEDPSDQVNPKTGICGMCERREAAMARSGRPATDREGVEDEILPEVPTEVPDIFKVSRPREVRALRGLLDFCATLGVDLRSSRAEAVVEALAAYEQATGEVYSAPRQESHGPTMTLNDLAEVYRSKRFTENFDKKEATPPLPGDRVYYVLSVGRAKPQEFTPDRTFRGVVIASSHSEDIALSLLGVANARSGGTGHVVAVEDNGPERKYRDHVIIRVEPEVPGGPRYRVID